MDQKDWQEATVFHGRINQGSAACAGLYDEKRGKLGPDPLREDADKELLWVRMQKSKAPVGRLLMDQEVVAGIGNIYRAEILYKVILFIVSCTQPKRTNPGPIMLEQTAGTGKVHRAAASLCLVVHPCNRKSLSVDRRAV